MKTNDALAMLAALSQESRLAVFRLLAEAGRAPGAIAEALDLPLPTLSFHLRTLRQAGLVQADRQGRSIRCRASFETMNGLIDYLSANRCGARP